MQAWPDFLPFLSHDALATRMIIFISPMHGSRKRNND